MADTYGEGNFQYNFVADWLKLPDGYKLLECPGVAVDGEDRVFILTRGEHPIMVFDKDGNFIRSFGEGLFSDNRTHGLYYSAADDSLLAADDGIPPPNPRLSQRNPRRGPKSQAIVDPRNAATAGLAVTWLHWRGPGAINFSPQVPEIGEGGRAATRVSFSAPGTYVLQAVADDTVHVTPVSVTVTVSPSAQ